MEEDDLKKFVDAHRQAFEQPADGLDDLWNRIDAGVQQKGREPLSLWKRPAWKVAASLLLLLACAWLFWPSTKALSPAEAELVEAEQFYQVEIDRKIQMLQAKNGALDPVIAENLAMLDQAMLELKEDLKDQADNEEVLAAMIKNYQLKLKILEEILQQLQKHEKDSIIHRGA
jgi:hypothetical protein